MNQTIETILHHRSIRKFTSEKLTETQINILIEAASRASTSSYMMAYSIIGVTNEEKKGELAKITGQPYVKENGHFLLFCADFHRHTLHASTNDYERMTANLENTEHFLVAAIDAALAAQNTAVAAESMGLGICYIGSIRNNIQQVDKLFQLPKHVIPLFGLAIGVPAEQPEQKPRLPQKAIYSENVYNNDSNLKPLLSDFDFTIENYYKKRTTNNRQDFWTNQMIRILSTPKRMEVTSFVQTKSFNKR